MFDDYPKAASNAATRALKHKTEYGSNCGTSVGWRSAGIISQRKPLTEDRLKRVYSFLSRAKVYDTGSFLDDGKEVCGSVMYAAWGGSSMLAYARKKVRELAESRASVGGVDGFTEAVATGLKNKVKEFNEANNKYKVTANMLAKVFKRGIGAYNTNPQSVRPSVKNAETWAYARVNSFLYAMKNEKFRSGKHDTDLFPEGHPLRSDSDEEKERARVGTIDGVAVYTTKEEAAAAAEKMGCSGTHEHQTDDGKTVYMPCSSHDSATDDDDDSGGSGGGYRSAQGVVHKRSAEGKVEVRQEGDGTTVVGYAAVFNSVTDLGSFREQIAPEAFTRVLEQAPDTVALLNHDTNLVLGRTTSGTLKLAVDEVGLRYELQLGNQSYARDLAESMRRGDINKSSFAFTIERESWQENVRTVEEVRGLYDISVVTRPAYNASSADIRSEEAASCGCNSKKELTKAPPAAPAPPKRAKLQKVYKTKYTMKNSDQLKSLRSSKLTELNALVEVAEAEARDYTEAEVQRQEQINKDVAELDDQIKRAEATEANVQRFAQMGATAPTSETVEVEKMKGQYNLQRALRDAAQGRLSGIENEMHQEALREAASYGIQLRGNVCIPKSFIESRNLYGNDSTGTPASAVTTTGTEVTPVIEALRPTPIIESLGATQLTGFVGDIKLPSMPSDAASLPAEGDAATAVSGAFTSQVLSPQRFATEITITKEALNQAAGNMSDVIARDFGNAIANAIDTHAFANIVNGGKAQSGVQITPAAADGDFNSAQGTFVQSTMTGDNDLAATSAADVLRLWGAISDSGIAENGSFVMRPATAGHLMTLAQVTNGTELMQGNRVLGYNAVFSTRVPQLVGTNVHADAVFSGGDSDVALGAGFISDIMFFGDFTHLFYAQWGGLSLTIDPFSGASAGTVKIVADNYYDAKLRNAKAVGFMLSSNATVAGADS